ncbi:MAG: YjbE family putative metal transport protein [Alphaproteobacteria bacterium]|nr:YjbE family putative metal transport protein [Alphaproteobacteria bacterium]
MEFLNTLLSGFDLEAFFTVIVIDLLLSADNTIVIGVAVSGLPQHLRKRALIFGILAATILRIVFALLTYRLLQVVGLTLAGGLMLLWVAYKMLRKNHQNTSVKDRKSGTDIMGAICLIIIADVALSLDNVLAVAGAAHDAPAVLVFGLGLSIFLMAFAANALAEFLEKYHWLIYIGIAVTTCVALNMVYRGYNTVEPYLL